MKKFFYILLAMGMVVVVKAAEPTPKMLQEVGIEPTLGTSISLDLKFQNEEGKEVRLGDFFDGKRPVILNLVYFGCPNLCTYVLNGMIEGLKGMQWTAGQEFQIVTVSIDPLETSDLAATKKKSYLEAYGRDAREGWHFLVGAEKNIQQLAGEVGFRYKYDEEIQQYAHAAGLFVLTPQGKLARVLFGIQFFPKDLRLALVEASEGAIGSVIDQILLYCYRFDPKASKYVLFASNSMRGAGALTVFALAFWIFKLGRGKPKQMRKKKR